MCCLFGLFDYKHNLSAEQKTQVIRILGTAAETRGTDASGIAYNDAGNLRIFKSPGPAHKAVFHIPSGADVVMGHTRMTTQGSAAKNWNNHPFMGKTRRQPFALAHNGVLWNDKELRKRLKLPCVKIETDSYVAVQLIERKKRLDFGTLRYMAELLEGSFTITVLNAENDLFIVKGDNPFCLYRYPKLGLYLYASTEEILKTALEYIQISGDAPENLSPHCGEIIRIQRAGKLDGSTFDDSKLFDFPACNWPYTRGRVSRQSGVEELRTVAEVFGYTPEDIDEMLSDGFTLEELEDYLCCGEI